MRVSVRLEAIGSSLEEVAEDARRRWAAFVGNPDAKLPISSEMSIETYEDSIGLTMYKATVLALTKVENNE
jgi:hypothetical protein